MDVKPKPRENFQERTFTFSTNESKESMTAAIEKAPVDPDRPLEGVIREKKNKRSLDMNAKFHAICSDIEKSGVTWCGKPRTAQQWKVLLVSGHAVATKEEAEIVPGLEGEFINIRESTALMSKRRGSSLIEYAIAWCALNKIRLSAPQSCDDQRYYR